MFVDEGTFERILGDLERRLFGSLVGFGTACDLLLAVSGEGC